MTRRNGGKKKKKKRVGEYETSLKNTIGIVVGLIHEKSCFANSFRVGGLLDWTVGVLYLAPSFCASSGNPFLSRKCILRGKGRKGLNELLCNFYLSRMDTFYWKTCTFVSILF